MGKLVVLLLALVAVSADDPRDLQRIVGGSTTTINQYPSMAALLFSTGNSGHRQSCGGIIINNRSILTAAHCTHRHAVARWRSRVGSTNANGGGTVFNSNRFINHGSYNHNTKDNDIGIIRVNGEIRFSNTVRQAPLGNYQVRDNEVVWAAGWGHIREGGPSSEQLRHVQIWTVNQNTCRQRYAPLNRAITDNMLCSGWLDVGGRDQCQGDSGGPVYHQGNVVGVTSFGQGCARARYPGVNARVSRYIGWINQNR